MSAARGGTARWAAAWIAAAAMTLAAAPGASAAAPDASAGAPAAATPANDRAGADASGTWRGSVMSLPIVVRLERTDDDGWKGLLDSPNQGVTNFSLDGVRVTADSISFALAAAGARFEGSRVGADSVTGTWSQAGQSISLGLRRGGSDMGPARPQEPRAPYPYRAEEVSYDGAVPGVRFAGTLTLPDGSGPFPAALLLTGSGPENRDEEIFGHKPFLVLADYLTRHGIAVLRVDDRGVGGSTGSLSNATLVDLADDANAGLEFLRGRADVAAGRVGLIGHSEGGLVAALAAERAKRPPAYAVLLSSPAVPLDSILRMQSAILGRAAGFSEDRLARERILYRRLHRALQAPGDSAAVAPEVKSIVVELLSALPPEAMKAAGGVDAVADRQLRTILTPAFRYFIRYDPAPALSALRIPVLALYGEKDTQVPAAENAGSAERIFGAAKHADATVRTLEGLNHLYQTANTGMLAEYGSIEETFAPAALDTVGAWIEARVGMETPPAPGARGGRGGAR
jgi:pimeloyl-ACP methyl ester carboxylesterase